MRAGAEMNGTFSLLAVSIVIMAERVIGAVLVCGSGLTERSTVAARQDARSTAERWCAGERAPGTQGTQQEEEKVVGWQVEMVYL